MSARLMGLLAVLTMTKAPTAKADSQSDVTVFQPSNDAATCSDRCLTQLSLDQSPAIAGGFLAGKYQRSDEGATGQGRLSGSNPFGNTKFSDRNWRVLDALRTVAAQIDRPLAQVALA